jgi:tRNA(Ile)-lysidine synthase
MSPPAAPPRSAGELTPPDPVAVGRFRHDLSMLRGLAWPPGQAPVGQPLVLAVSGGVDSMAMLVLAHAAFPGDVRAVTVDHGLRAAAAREAEWVAEFCAVLGVPHHTLTLAGVGEGSSVQRKARDARYLALARWADAAGSRELLTAHHADDQAETLLMRLNRSSGTAGLSGIRPIRFDGHCVVLRPLLRWRRSELVAVAEQSGTRWIDDPSNTDPRHDRTRYRAFLAGQTLLDPAALADAAAHIWEAEEALFTFAQRYWLDRWDYANEVLRIGDLPRELQRRLVRRAIEEVREAHGIATPPFSYASNIESLLNALETGQRATQAGIMATPRADGWHFEPAPPRRSQ